MNSTDPEDKPDEELPDDPDWGNVPPLCPHDKPWGECGACDHASDLAYDAERERRFFH